MPCVVKSRFFQPDQASTPPREHYLPHQEWRYDRNLLHPYFLPAHSYRDRLGRSGHEFSFERAHKPILGFLQSHFDRFL